MSQHQQQPPPPSLGGAPPAAFHTAVNTAAMTSATGITTTTSTSTSTTTTTTATNTTKASKKKAAAPKKATGPAATKAKAPKKPAAPRTKKTSSAGAAGAGTAGTTGGKKTSGSNSSSNNNNNNASGLTSAAALAAANAEMIQADATIARLDLAKQRSMAIQRKSDPLWYRIEDVLLVPALPSQSGTYSNNHHHNSHIATVITNTVLPEQIAVVDRALSHAGGLQRSDVTPQAMVCLMEQARRIAYELMTDAQDYAYAAGRSEITVPDLILAQELRSDLSSSSNVTTQLPKLNLTAQQMNRVPLPPIPIQCYNGVVLPPKAHQLTARTFDVVTASMVAQKMIQPVPKSPASMKKSPNHNNDAKGSSTTTTTATGGYGASRGQRQIPISLKSTNTSTNIATVATTTTSSTSTSTTANPVTTTTTPPLTNLGPATSSTIAPDNITPPSNNSNGPNVEQQPLPPTATPQMGVVDITGTQPPDSSTTIRMPNQSALNTATPMEDVTITTPPEVGQTLLSLPPPPPQSQNDTTSSTSMDIAATTTSSSNPSSTLQPP